MSSVVCSTCLGPRATYLCGLCQVSVCKKCVKFLDDHALSFLGEMPPELQHTNYCVNCYEQNVAPVMAEYDKILEKAEKIAVFYIQEGKRTRLMARNEKLFTVNNCNDERETLMRLAFMAAKGNFNSIIDVDITFEKVYTNSYQTSVFKGSARPTNLNPGQLNWK